MIGSGGTVPAGASRTFRRPVVSDEPDRSRLLFREEDVTPRFGLRPNHAYDLALFAEQGSNTRAVLVVTLVVQLQFSDGRGTRPGDELRPLVWTRPEKAQFAADFKSTVTRIWERKHRLITTSSIPQFKSVGVRFDVQTIIDDFDLDDHWELTVTKVDTFTGSSVTPFTGNAEVDSLDLTPVGKNGAPAGVLQTPAAHEFGHMLGLRDEYASADENLNFTGDHDSILNVGDKVRDRHYASFAAWINEQFETAGKLGGEKIEYLVNGTLPATSARL